MKKSSIALLVALTCSGPAFAQQAAVVKNDMQIDGLDPGIKIFVREKTAQGNTWFANDNVVLFLHGATGPSTCDFDLQYKDYSWADWLVNRGYVVYMGDFRNYGGSTREAAMDEPANKNQPVTRSYLALRKPTEFNFALGAYRVASEAANTARWNGEIPIENKDEYRDPALPAAFWNECLATDPTSNSRTPPSLRAPNGVLENSFYQATGRPLWNAANIYVPTLVIGGDFDTWSFQEDREGLMRALVHAPTKRNVLIKDATHFVLFEKNRNQFFEEILKFMKE